MNVRHILVLLSLSLLQQDAVIALDLHRDVHFTLVQITDSPDCASPADEYRVQVQTRSCSGQCQEWTQWSERMDVVQTHCANHNLTRSSTPGGEIGARICNYTLSITDVCTQIRLVQLDHRGGYCDCWASAVHDQDYRYSASDRMQQGGYGSLSSLFQTFSVTSGQTDVLLESFGVTDNQFNGACRLSASAPRVMVFDRIPCNSSDTDTFVNNVEVPEIGENCSNRPHVVVKFDLQFAAPELGIGSGLNSFDEGVEFAFRVRNVTDWVPLRFYTSVSSIDRELSIAVNDLETLINSGVPEPNLQMRGFNVSYSIIDENVLNVDLKMCGELIENSIFMKSDCLEFRWLQTVRQVKRSNITKFNNNTDVAKLSNVAISLNSSSFQHQFVLLQDSFTEPRINATRWNSRYVARECAAKDNCFAKFGRDAPTFTPAFGDETFDNHTIVSRQISTTCLGANLSTPKISYKLITASSPDCLQPQLGPFPAPVQLQYQLGNTDWITLAAGNESVLDRDNSSAIQVTKVTIDVKEQIFTNNRSIKFRFIQPEHRGGFCDCWSVADLTVIHWADHDLRIIFEESEQCSPGNAISDIFMLGRERTWPPAVLKSATIKAEQCQGSASVPREFTLIHEPGSNRTRCSMEPVVTEHGDTPAADCSDEDLRIELTFDLKFVHNTDKKGCYPIDSFHEGVELSFKTTPTAGAEWIPLVYYTRNTDLSDTSGSPSMISLTNETISGARGNFSLRGYNTPYVITDGRQFTVTLCEDNTVLQRPMEFRWLQTSLRGRGDGDDVISLKNITVNVRNGTHSANLYDQSSSDFSMDPFISRLDNIHSKSDCDSLSQGPALFFYNDHATLVDPDYSISSRQIVIGPLDPRNITLQPNPVPPSTTSPIVTTTLPPSDSEENIRNEILGDENLREIFNQISEDPQGALNSLGALLGPSGSGNSSGDNEVSLTAATYLLSSIKNSLGSETLLPDVSKMFLSVSDSLLNTSLQSSEMPMNNSTEDDGLAGSTLLQVLDNFALDNFDASEGLPDEDMPDNILIEVREMFTETPIDEENAKIKLPKEILRGDSKQQVRIASFLFRNMSGILPASLNGTENNSDSENDVVSRLASPVISASFQCNNCTTSNLSQPVKVTFKLSDYDEALLKNDNRSSVKCVFWKFENVERDDAVLFPGEWSEDGCQTSIDRMTGETVCSCNHLTHFAILLSAKPLQISESHTLALGIIGQVGVAISLVAMLMTIAVFIFLNRHVKRPLYTMRNYIHIQLCITLGIAQIIFVAGIEPNLGEGKLVGGVPLGCRLVAVLLHYWFLVSFMWMLMEGVVLYVALVRVFAEHYGRYMAAFTIASYGLPLLYVGGLTVPLGFARTEEMRQNQTYDYGYKGVCYLNPATSFIWSLIVPVVLVFLANIGFFIMAIVILCKHQKGKEKKKKAKQVRNWLKACTSLTVVMGLTWILGFLVVEKPHLLFLAYIFTFCVAFQGLFIFVIFVVVSESKRLREIHAKWWKSTVRDSEFLSKHFGSKSSTTTYTLSTQQVQVSQFAVAEKGTLARGQLGDSFEKEEPSNDGDDDKGTFFEVLYVPPIDTKKEDILMTSFSGESEEKKFDLENILIPDTVSSSSCDETKEGSDITEPSTCSVENKDSGVAESQDQESPSVVKNGDTLNSSMNCTVPAPAATEITSNGHHLTADGTKHSTSADVSCNGKVELGAETNTSVECV